MVDNTYTNNNYMNIIKEKSHIYKELIMNPKTSPIAAVWEITMGCNMRCMHCGSSCEGPLEGELTTKEALNLCDELGRLGLKWITLSGGEPTTRRDWDLIARRLFENNILVSVISNGWIFQEETAIRAKSSGVNAFAFSLDGLQATHDRIRKAGSYDKIMSAIDYLVANGLPCSIITTINSLNIEQLDSMYEILSKKKIFAWQLQIGLPMGNMVRNREHLSKPEHIDEVINFAYRHLHDDSLLIHFADCIGYFNQKEIEVRGKKTKSESYSWIGCHAGKNVFGILHNGDIVGCTSVRNKDFIEGNIRETPIREIWEDPERFKWNMTMSKEKLKGLCGKCAHGSRCLGGCSNTRLTMEGSIYGENNYCSYNIAVKEEQKKINKISNKKKLYKKAVEMANAQAFQISEMLLRKLIKSKGYDYDVYALYGYVAFMLENYADAYEINRELVTKNPDDVYANKGLGLTLAKLGQVDEGIMYLNKAIELSKDKFTDAYHDLSVVLLDNNRCEEALAAVEKGRELSEEYKKQSEEYHKHLVNIISSSNKDS